MLNWTELSIYDPDVAMALDGEGQRQSDSIELIASENFVSKAVLEAQGSVLTNKYAEGYPHRRYYGGCQYADAIEQLAINRACELFKAEYANVQPHSGSQANQAVFLALLNPGDLIMGMDLSAGGHLTHGSKANISGRWFEQIAYTVESETGYIDMNQVAELAHKNRPKLIIAGGSAYSRIIDFAAFREIADSVGAYLLVDMAHFAGLVAVGRYPNPIQYAHVVTTTTHKTLRGPRGGCIFTNDSKIASQIDRAVFPGLQGGPLMHVIAAKAVAFQEALQPSFGQYIDNVIGNAKALAETLLNGGVDVVSGGTDSHLILVDLRPLGITGSVAEKALEAVGITCNKNGVPFDPEKPAHTSGIRLGSAACTTRGFGEIEFRNIGKWILLILHSLSSSESARACISSEVKTEVQNLCAQMPLYSKNQPSYQVAPRLKNEHVI
jgi:glycine hydroxymethyltransferase